MYIEMSRCVRINEAQTLQEIGREQSTGVPRTGLSELGNNGGEVREPARAGGAQGPERGFSSEPWPWLQPQTWSRFCSNTTRV